jgi:hypothetical protein
MKNDEHHELERLLAGLEPPPPPGGLRARAVAAARERMAAAPAPDLWSRIWNNRGLRVAWAAAVVLLLAAHVLVSRDPGTAFTSNRPVIAEAQRDEQFIEILRPARISADVHPTIGLFAAAEDPNTAENGGNPS